MGLSTLLAMEGMDPTAVWTALGAIGTIVLWVIGTLIAENRRLRLNLDEKRNDLTDHLLRLTHEQHKRREAEQLLSNLRAIHQLRKKRKEDSGETDPIKRPRTDPEIEALQEDDEDDLPVSPPPSS
jgi:hypothetical protein